MQLTGKKRPIAFGFGLHGVQAAKKMLPDQHRFRADPGVNGGHLKAVVQRSNTSATPGIALIAALPFADTA
jgi:hypothetical protein